MDVSYILDDLNSPQREAVSDESQFSLILAGAGSGKTRVITHKVAWLCKVHNLNPMSLLTVTFTNKAAKEMRGRIENILGEQLNQMWCGTFHSLFHRMLRRHWEEAGLPKSFSILDSEDQNRVIKRVIKSLELDDATWQPSQAQWFINNQKEEGRRKAKIKSSASFVEEKMVDIMDEYQKTCDREGLVDFAEMGSALFKSLFPSENPKVGLLNIGSEEIKGTEILKKAYTILNEMKSNDFEFNGFIEANKIMDGKTNVIVTDGFTGNIALKTAEGTAKFITDSLKKYLTETILAKISIIFSYFALKKFKSKLDPRKFNGAIFLGLKGPVVKSHGSTDALGFYHSIDLCYRIIKGDLMEKIRSNLSHVTNKK